MGGLIAARLAEDPTVDLPGLVLSSPFLRLKMPVPIWKRAAARILSVAAPSVELPSGLPLEWISHDKAIVDATRLDPLSHRDSTPRWFTEISAAQPRTVEAAASIRAPVLLLYAGDDKIADASETERFYQRLVVPKSSHRYEGFYHEIFNEVGRERVFEDLYTWLELRT